MDDTMRLPRWMSRNRAEDDRRERASDVRGDAVMADLGRLTMQLADAVERIKRTVPDDKDDS